MARETLAQLEPRLRRRRGSWCIPPSPPRSAMKGAANHMRLCAAHDAAPGVEIFVYGITAAGRSPRASTDRGKSEAVARRAHGSIRRAPCSSGSPMRSDRGGGVSQRCGGGRQRTRVLFAHECRLCRSRAFLRRSARPLARGGNRRGARPGGGQPGRCGRLLSVQRATRHRCRRTIRPSIVPARSTRECTRCGAGYEAHRRGQWPDPRVSRSSMCANRWPMAAARRACRLRVVADPATIDPRFLVDAPRSWTASRRSSNCRSLAGNHRDRHCGHRRIHAAHPRGSKARASCAARDARSCRIN